MCAHHAAVRSLWAVELGVESLKRRAASYGPTQAAERATRAPQGDSFHLRRGFGSVSARIISPVMTIVSRFVTTTYKPGSQTG